MATLCTDPSRITDCLAHTAPKASAFGIITPEGYFDFLFNICQDGARTSDAINVNQFGVPDGHEMIAEGEVVEDPYYFEEKTVVASGSDEHASVGARGGTKYNRC